MPGGGGIGTQRTIMPIIGQSTDKWGRPVGVGGIANSDSDKVNKLTPSDIAEDQYKYYQDTFVPIERGLKGQIRSPQEIESLAGNASTAAGSGKAAGEFMRNAGRMGINLSQDQKEEFLGSYVKSAVGAKAGAKTRVRSGLYDQNVENLGNFVGLGRGLATSSQDALSDASANQAAVQNANKQAKAASNASKVGVGATLVVAAAYVF